MRAAVVVTQNKESDRFLLMSALPPFKIVRRFDISWSIVFAMHLDIHYV
jgi:hypothetical protein